MNVEMIMNDKGEVQKQRIELPIDILDTPQAMTAVKNLAVYIGAFGAMKERGEVSLHKTFLYGYTSCCMDCGFITEEGRKELLKTIDHLAAERHTQIGGKETHAK